MGRARLVRVVEGLMRGVRPRRDWVSEVVDWGLSRPGLRVGIGPPGTGKTAWAVDYAGTTLLRPLRVHTFTRSAAVEFRSRLVSTEGVWVGTVDSLVVGSVGLRSMVRVGNDVEWGIERLRRAVSASFGFDYFIDKYARGVGNVLFHAFDYAANAGGREGIEWLINRVGEVDQVAGRALWTYYKCVDGRVDSVVGVTCGLDFTMARVLVGEGGRTVPIDGGLPRAVVVDEAQDLSLLMWLIVARASGPGVEELVVVGDPDQAIYGGLHPIVPEIFSSFARRGGVVVLRQSYRVPDNIARIAQAYLSATVGGSVWRGWVGTRGRGSFRFVSYLDMYREVLGVYGRLRTFILTPTNSSIIPISINLMRLGVVPRFLKGVPSQVLDLFRKARDYLLGGGATTLDVFLGGGGPSGVGEYVSAVVDLVRRRVEELRLLYPGESFEALLERAFGEFEPRRLTYEADPHGYLYIDTVHTAKGLEADLVFIINFLRVGEREPEPSANLFYVALTRARAGVRIVSPPGPGWRHWVDTLLLKRLAQGVVEGA